MRYVLPYLTPTVSRPVREGAWSVYLETYESPAAFEPIYGTTRHARTFPSEAEADTYANALYEAQRRLVPVVSFVYYSGDRVGPDEEVSSGGFDWYYTLADAEEAYEVELRTAGVDPSACRVRLVCVSVPQGLDGQDLTDYLDADLGRIEYRLPARREANVGGIYREAGFYVNGRHFTEGHEADDYALFLRSEGTPAQVVEVAA